MAYGNLQPKRVKLANMFEATKILRKKSEKAKKSSKISKNFSVYLACFAL